MFFSVVGIGFLIGIQHAFEADHVAAVSSFAARRTGVKKIARHGLFWGLGHTLTLMLVAGTLVLFRFTIDAQLGAILEMAVGVAAVTWKRIW